MDFVVPSSIPPLPTYHVMKRNGLLADPTREPPKVKDEEVVVWYKNMLAGAQ